MCKHRTYISILLFALIGLPTIISVISGTYIEWLKFEMKEKLEYANLERITLKNENVVWYERDHEIKVQGALFDVKSYATHGDSTTFEGIFDHSETAYSMLAEKMTNKSPNHQHLAQIGSYFHQPLFFELAVIKNTDFYSPTSKHCKRNNSMHIFFYPPVPTPPPDSSLS